MAAVAVVLISITIPLVMLQRRLVRTANRFITMKGKRPRPRALPLGKWRWVAGIVVVAWLTVTIGVPLIGVALRAFISNWGVGVSLWDELSLATFRSIWQQPNLLRAIVNSMAIGVFGGALAVVCYLFVGIAMPVNRITSRAFLATAYWCRAPCQGCWPGWRFCGCFCFADVARSVAENGWLSTLPVADWLREHLIVQLRALRNTIFSVWLAYTVVWMAYGLRLISSTLLRVAPKLEGRAQYRRIARADYPSRYGARCRAYGLISSWLLMFSYLRREYSTGSICFRPEPKRWFDAGSRCGLRGYRYRRRALSFINILLVVVGLGIALR